MFLRHNPSGGIVEILDLEALTDPFKTEVKGRFHAGDEMLPDRVPKVRSWYSSPVNTCRAAGLIRTTRSERFEREVCFKHSRRESGVDSLTQS